MADKTRCAWVSDDPLYIDYHDTEWGVPSRDDRHLFEFLILEGAQAGLSWITVLRRRETYRAAFADFDPNRVARFGARDRKRLLADKGIIRNRAKVDSSIQNAKCFLEVQQEFGTFADYLWAFVDNDVLASGPYKTVQQVPAETAESKALSKDLKGRGFSFVGPTIMYAYMQSVGMVNDHTVDCFRYSALDTLKSG